MIYLELFYVFFKIGLFTFGGGYAMLPLIQAEVEGRGWVSGPDLVDFIAVSESTPGPFAVNISTYVGTQLGGIPGALCATLGVVLPSFIIILVIARFVARFRNSLAVTGCLNGLKPAVSGLIAASVISVGYTVFFPSGINTGVFVSPAFYASLAIFALSVFMGIKKLHPVIIICVSDALGIAAGYAFDMSVAA